MMRFNSTENTNESNPVEEVWKINNRYLTVIKDESYTFTDNTTLTVEDFYKEVGFIYKLEDQPYTDGDKLWSIDHVYNVYTKECIGIKQDIVSRDIFIAQTPKKFFRIENEQLYITLLGRIQKRE